MEQWTNWATIIGTLFGLIGVLLAIIFYLKGRVRKQLDYDVDVVPFLNHSTNPEWHSRVIVSVDGIEVTQPYLVSVSIVNTGNRAIQAHEFTEPICLSFGAHRPLSASISRASTPELLRESPDNHGEQDGSALRYRPRLMNAHEWFEVSILFDGQPDDLSISCRFADQHQAMSRIRRDHLGEAVSEALGSPPARIVTRSLLGFELAVPGRDRRGKT